MAFEDSDRRRAVLLTLLTIIALPTIYLVTRSDEPAADGAVAASSGPNRAPIDFVQDKPVFLDGPILVREDEPATIAVPQRPAQESVRLTASFRSSVAGARSCLVVGVESRITVRIENIDNGRSLTCVTGFAPFDQQVDVVLPPASFAELADLTEAPITIELTRT
jgi:hypothetical protein